MAGPSTTAIGPPVPRPRASSLAPTSPMDTKSHQKIGTEKLVKSPLPARSPSQQRPRASSLAPVSPMDNKTRPRASSLAPARPMDAESQQESIAKLAKSPVSAKRPSQQRAKLSHTASQVPSTSNFETRSRSLSSPLISEADRASKAGKAADAAGTSSSRASISSRTSRTSTQRSLAGEASATSWIDAREGYQLMAMHLWRGFQRDSLFNGANSTDGKDIPCGVAIRYGKAQYVVCPSGDERLADFCQSVAVLNCEAAMTLASSVVAAITTRLAPSTRHVPVTPSQHIQVVDDMLALAGARKAQNACFVRSENILVVWADQVEILRERARDLEDKMMTFVWTSSYYNNANNLMVSLAKGTATPAVASPTATSPTSTAFSDPASPITPGFPSISSVANFAALNQSNFQRAARNHQRSYAKDPAAFQRRSTSTSINSTDNVTEGEGKGKEPVIDDVMELPTSPGLAVLRPANSLRHVSFSEPATEARFRDPWLPSASTLEEGRPTAPHRRDSLRTAIPPHKRSEGAALGMWSNQSTMSETLFSHSTSSRSSILTGDEKEKGCYDEGRESFDDDTDFEKQDVEYEQRPLSYLAPLQHGFAVGLNILICFLFISRLFLHSLQDGSWNRMALSLVTIIMFPVILFFCDNCLGIIMQLVGPVNQLHQNSLYFSGKAPERKLAGDLPHITIQMPVYKESLEGVLMPTIESVKKAITTYELQGGTAGIIVSEDGMLLVDEQEQTIRKEFYERNNVGWVARPGHNKDGYVRKGRFKKASNLNFTCHLSMAIEEMMGKERPTTFGELESFRSNPDYLKPTKDAMQDTEKPTDLVQRSGLGQFLKETGQVKSQPLAMDDWTDADETELYRRCLEASLPRMHRLAQAKGNVRLGQLILLIDSDTRVPEDCLLDAASEMMQCPDVGVLQHCSGVMLVSDSYFELCIAFFTRLVNFAISFTVANGDVAPFMGHNAILRWSAMQEASFVDPEDGVRKIWSESHVSEDFDMALRLLMSGYITRWATYSNNGFEEGVSLTCDDELNRWQKYAFGCSELVLHRLWEWPYKGIFTPLFKTFLKSPAAPIHYKFSACSYIFSYYAIGAAFPVTWALYFVEGWCYPVLDPSFLTPFKIWVSVVMVFTLGGNVAQIVARYRAKVDTLFNLIKEHFAWMPCMFVFFGGLSYHVATALLSHPLGIDMSWGATNKDLADSNFFLEVPLIWKRFWKVIVLCFATIATVIVMQISTVVPLDWSIQGFFTYWPLLLTAVSHLIYPIVLNPALLRFSF